MIYIKLIDKILLLINHISLQQNKIKKLIDTGQLNGDLLNELNF